MVTDESAVILQALRFSANKHRNQRRKDNNSPYINHPIDVAEVLMTVGGVRELDVIVAAILHDTIEDTDTLPQEIEDLFGNPVLSLVLEVTDDKSLPKKMRKQLQVDNAPHKSLGAKQIKIADKISNLRDIMNSPPANWTRERKLEYVDWSENVVAGLRGANPKLESLYDETLRSVRSQLTAE